MRRHLQVQTNRVQRITSFVEAIYRRHPDQAVSLSSPVESMGDPEYKAGHSWVQPALDDQEITRSRIQGTGASSMRIYRSCIKVEDHDESVSESFDKSITNSSRKRIAKIVFLHLTIMLAVISTFVLLFASLNAPTLLTNLPASCNSDGIFWYQQPYNQATSGFFQITLGFGSMSFPYVKLIDVIWDVVIGRGGQCQVSLSCIEDPNLLQAKGYSAVLRTRFSSGR